ncbi:MAG: hypothetical protein PHD74_09450, partial [Candidatus Krumholzibacteria bacterium]|nr:hypothetical protein [Candidatus Krumholzibacteria bacterium]
MKRSPAAISLIGIALLAGCSTPKTVLVPLAPGDSDAYAGAKSILVVLKTAEVYEMKNFSVRGDSLMGTRILRRESGAKKGEWETVLALEDISSIQVATTSGRGDMFL